MAKVIFSEEPLTDNHCQAKQGRKFFPASAVRVRMTVQGTDHDSACKLKALLPLGDVLLVAYTVLGSNNLHLLHAIL